MLESPKGPTVLAPTTIIEKMIRNRNRVSTRGYEGSGLGFATKKRSLAIETVTNSDIYLNSQFTIGTTGREYTSAVSARPRRVVNM